MGIMFQTPINEVYFGKSKELLDIEKQLDVFRNKYMGRYTLNMKVNSDPELLKFDRMVEQFFGFGCFSMHIVNQPIANGYTIPIDFRYDVTRDKDNIIADDKTFKFKKSCDYSCLVCSYSGIMFNSDFTTEEVMAMVMHEIGHNFNSFINQKNAKLVNVYMAIEYVYTIASIISGAGFFNMVGYYKKTNSYRKMVDELGKQMRKRTPNGLLINIYDLIKQIGDICATGVHKLQSINKILSMGTMVLFSTIGAIPKTIISAIKDPISVIIGKPMKYKSERSADNFATMYGYGPATVTLQTKLQTSAGSSADSIMRTFDKIPLISTITHTVELPAMILLTAFDEHPEGVNRALDQLNLLKHEVNKEDIDPKMRKVLLADIAACEEKMGEFTNTKDGISDPYLARHAYNQYLMAINGDLKHYFMDQKDKFNQYDKVFDDVVMK